jgi:hypothetical protein
MRQRQSVPRIRMRHKSRGMKSMTLKMSVKPISIRLYPFLTKLKMQWEVSIKKVFRK